MSIGGKVFTVKKMLIINITLDIGVSEQDQ